MFLNHRTFERCRRLVSMSRDELRVRTGQEIAKRWDLIRYWAGGDFVPNGCDFFPESSARFFFTPEELPDIINCLRERLPDVAADIVQRAERICEHRFDLLGYEGLDYGTEIDWHLDVVHGKRAPRRPWFKIRYLDFAEVGDSKVTWELSRHQHLVTLAKAYRLTGRTHYVLELLRQWYHWQEQNPYPIGINWASSLEVAFRSLSWLWIGNLLNSCSVTSERFSSDLRRALMLNACHIEKFLSTYFSPNTHLLGEGVGLFSIGTLHSEVPAADRWRKLGWQIVVDEAKRQVLPDGVHFEQSIYYHVYALDFFLHARMLANANDMPIPATVDQTLEKMLNALCTLGKVGPLPAFGDDDGGRVFEPRRNRSEHLLDPLATGAVLFNRSDFKLAADGIREETLWLCGIKGVRQFDELSIREDSAMSFAFEWSGMYGMASPRPVPQQLIVDAGPQGAGRAGHGHADGLSIQVSVGGSGVLIDPGTLAYVDPDGKRNRFRGTASHNTVQVDGVDQAAPGGPFGWYGLPNVNVDRWITSDSFDFFEGSHTGYRRLSSPVHHRRCIFYFKPHFWVVRDVLEGTGTHNIALNWHFAPGWLSGIPGGAHFSSIAGATLALMLATVHDPSTEIRTDWCAPVYGKSRQAPLLRFEARAALPAEFATILIPCAQRNVASITFKAMSSIGEGVSVSAYQYSIDGLNHHMFFADENRNWQLGRWSSDARFACCVGNSRNILREIAICDGSYFYVGGKRAFHSKTKLSCAHRTFDQSELPGFARNVELSHP